MGRWFGDAGAMTLQTILFEQYDRQGYLVGRGLVGQSSEGEATELMHGFLMAMKSS